MLFSYHSSLAAALQAVYPEHPWQPEKFIETGHVPAGYWLSKSNIRDALVRAEKRLDIQEVHLSFPSSSLWDVLISWDDTTPARGMVFGDVGGSATAGNSSLSFKSAARRVAQRTVSGAQLGEAVPRPWQIQQAETLGAGCGVALFGSAILRNVLQ